MSNENYLFRKRRLLRNFDISISRVKPSLLGWLGEVRTGRLFYQARQEYEVLIPRIPYIGRNNPLLMFLLPATRYLAVYRALQEQGFGVEEAGRLSFLIGTEEIRALPNITRRFISYLWFTPWFRARIKRRAVKSHQRRYPGDYVLNYVAGDGCEFDYGVDYLECASCKFLEAENASELTPYVCAVDKTASELLGWGLQRTMTLAEGSHRCDFRFKKGRETQVVTPLSLERPIREVSI